MSTIENNDSVEVVIGTGGSMDGPLQGEVALDPSQSLPLVDAVDDDEAKREREELRQATKEIEDTIEVITPNKEHQTVILGEGEDQMKFTQKPLTYLGKLNFFAFIARSIDEILVKEDGLSITDLFQSLRGAAADEAGAVEVGDVGTFFSRIKDPDVMLLTIARFVEEVPEFVKDAYCIFLNVKSGQRERAKELMDEMDDEQGIAIINTFMDQNVEAIQDFFVQELPKIFRRGQLLVSQAQAQSKNQKD